MNMQHSPVLAAVVAKQRQQELRIKAVASRVPAVSAHRLSGAARRVAFRLSAW